MWCAAVWQVEVLVRRPMVVMVVMVVIVTCKGKGVSEMREGEVSEACALCADIR